MHFYKSLTTNKLKVQRMVENAVITVSHCSAFRVSLSVLQGGPSHSLPQLSFPTPLLSSWCPGCILQVPPCHEGCEDAILGSTLEDDSGFLESQKVVQIL